MTAPAFPVFFYGASSQGAAERLRYSSRAHPKAAGNILAIFPQEFHTITPDNGTHFTNKANTRSAPIARCRLRIFRSHLLPALHWPGRTEELNGQGRHRAGFREIDPR